MPQQTRFDLHFSAYNNSKVKEAWPAKQVDHLATATVIELTGGTSPFVRMKIGIVDESTAAR